MKVYIKENNDYIFIQSPYHEKISSLFKSIESCKYIIGEGYCFNKANKMFIIDNLINMGVNVEEVDVFPLKPILPKIAIYQILGDKLEIAIKYCPKVNVNFFWNFK